MDKTTSFTVEQIRALCGGQLPYANGFAWDRVDHFELEEGVIQPYSDGGQILPGPGIIFEWKEAVGLFA